MSAHYQLTEDDEVLIYEARYQLQFVLDITCSIPPGKQFYPFFAAKIIRQSYLSRGWIEL